jgi:hypothetical protein
VTGCAGEILWTIGKMPGMRPIADVETGMTASARLEFGRAVPMFSRHARAHKQRNWANRPTGCNNACEAGSFSYPNVCPSPRTVG